MPTRSRAAGITGVILGGLFLLRAIGDVTTAHWLLNVTPLGWVEKAQPLANAQPLWLLPFFGVLLVTLPLTVYLAGKRDYAESIISDKTNTKPHFGLLSSPFRLAVRLTRGNNIGWLSAIFVTALIYGLITKSTGQIFSQSKSFEKVITHLAQQVRLSSVLEFLGLVFFIQMMLIMAYAANAMAAIRRDEALGYIDNFLVQPFSRFRWLIGRLTIVGGVLVLAGLITTAGIWQGLASQHTGVTFNTLFLASINALVPAVLLVGVAVFTFGVYPRLTSIMAYAVLAWSLLIELIGTGLNINHWLLDTSVLHQVVLAPTVNPNWSVNLVIVVLAGVLACLGMLRFHSRDIEGE
jgi:ABC-2 type transport system permease protein